MVHDIGGLSYEKRQRKKAGSADVKPSVFNGTQ